MTRTGVVLALVVAGIVGFVLYLTWPTLLITCIVLGGLWALWPYMTATNIGLALIVATIVGGLLYLLWPVFPLIWILLGGLWLLDAETATALRLIVFVPLVGMIVAVIALVVADVRDALAIR